MRKQFNSRLVAITILVSSFPCIAYSMDSFERKLHASMRLLEKSQVQFEECTIEVVNQSPYPCTHVEQYKSHELRIDLREVEHIVLRGSSDRQFLEFKYSQNIREVLERAYNSLMDRTFDHILGDFNGTPLRRYATAEKILSENGVRSGSRSVQCNGLKTRSISSSLNEYVVFGGDSRYEVLQQLRAELDMCRVGM